MTYKQELEIEIRNQIENIQAGLRLGNPQTAAIATRELVRVGRKLQTVDTDTAHDECLELAEENAIGTELQAPCQECDGTAIDGAGLTCQECNGGRQPATVVECPDCNGHGWHLIGSDDDCHTCNALGRVVEHRRLTMWAVTVDQAHGTITHLVYEELGQLDELLSRIDHKSMIMEKVTV